MTGRGRDLRGDHPEGTGIAANQPPVPGDSAVRTGPIRRVRDLPLHAGPGIRQPEHRVTFADPSRTRRPGKVWAGLTAPRGTDSVRRPLRNVANSGKGRRSRRQPRQEVS